MEPTQEEIDNLELRSEEVQEILGTPPHWLVRWGITVIFFSVICLIASSWWIEYPDIIKGEITITTRKPPIKIIAAISGNINTLLIEDNQSVRANQRLAILKSVAKAEDVFELEVLLDQFKDLEPDALLEIDFESDKKLGELQSDYSRFIQYLEDYQLFLSEQIELKKIPYLKREIQYYRNLNLVLLSKDSVLQDEIAVAEEQYKRQLEVAAIGGNVKRDVEEAQTALLKYKGQNKETGLNLINNRITINRLKSEIAGIRSKTQEAGLSKFIKIKESYKHLQGQLQAWLKDYVLIAPIDGKASFHNYWSEQQFVAAGEEVMTIVPVESDVIGKINLTIEGSGKVEENQLVNIKLASYPFREYGIVKGKIKRIALAPFDGTYAVEVELTNGLHTSYKKELLFRQQMKGTAEIITKDRRLLERLLESLIF